MLPKYADIEGPLLHELARRGGSARPADVDASGQSVYAALAAHFRLTPADLGAVIYENGVARSTWENMVRYAVRALRAKGAIQKGGTHGVWAIMGQAKRHI